MNIIKKMSAVAVLCLGFTSSFSAQAGGCDYELGNANYWSMVASMALEMGDLKVSQFAANQHYLANKAYNACIDKKE